MAGKYRHEYKFLVDERDLCLAANRLKNLMPLDSHAGEDGYHIRSVYFDDYRNSCYHENEAGTDPRVKYRIRIYDASGDRITLEKKSKKSGMTLKESAVLTREQYEALMAGRPLPLYTEEAKDWPDVIKQLSTLTQTRQMRPKVIVEYQRIPYIYKDGNVRVTFDRNLTASGQVGRFLEPQLLRRPVMPAGKHILEVKFDDFLPGFLKNQLELGTLKQTSFSKYYLCRRYSK